MKELKNYVYSIITENQYDHLNIMKLVSNQRVNINTIFVINNDSYYSIIKEIPEFKEINIERGFKHFKLTNILNVIREKILLKKESIYLKKIINKNKIKNLIVLTRIANPIVGYHINTTFKKINVIVIDRSGYSNFDNKIKITNINLKKIIIMILNKIVYSLNFNSYKRIDNKIFEYIKDPLEHKLIKEKKTLTNILEVEDFSEISYIRNYSKLKLILLMQPLVKSRKLDLNKFDNKIIELLKIAEKLGIKREEIGIKNHPSDSILYQFSKLYTNIPKSIPFDNIQISNECILLTFSSTSTRLRKNYIISYMWMIDSLPNKTLRRLEARLKEFTSLSRNIVFPKSIDEFENNLKKIIRKNL